MIFYHFWFISFCKANEWVKLHIYLAWLEVIWRLPYVTVPSLFYIKISVTLLRAHNRALPFGEPQARRQYIEETWSWRTYFHGRTQIRGSRVLGERRSLEIFGGRFRFERFIWILTWCNSPANERLDKRVHDHHWQNHVTSSSWRCSQRRRQICRKSSSSCCSNELDSCDSQ